MELRDMRALVAIAEEGGISKAAERLHMAQPPLTQQLKALEASLGVTLFERTTRRLRITDAGKIMYQRSREIIDRADMAVREVKDTHDGLSGRLSIGTVSAAGATVLPGLLSRFHASYPDVTFEIIDENTERIQTLLSDGLIDIGIIRTPGNISAFESMTLSMDALTAIGEASYFTGNGNRTCETVSIKDLEGLPLLLPHRHLDAVETFCKNLGFQPQILCRSNDVRTILHWAETSMGIAIVPENCLPFVTNTRLVHRRLDEPSLSVGTAVIWRKNSYRAACVRHFLELAAAE